MVCMKFPGATTSKTSFNQPTQASLGHTMIARKNQDRSIQLRSCLIGLLLCDLLGASSFLAVGDYVYHACICGCNFMVCVLMCFLAGQSANQHHIMRKDHECVGYLGIHIPQFCKTLCQIIFRCAIASCSGLQYPSGSECRTISRQSAQPDSFLLSSSLFVT